MIYKPRNFDIVELVDPVTYMKYGESSWKFLDERAVRTLQWVRDLLGVPLIVNNWNKGGVRLWSGLRINDSRCKEYRERSQHCFDEATEILTDIGWTTISSANSATYVVTLNPNTFKVEKQPITQKIIRPYNGTLYGVKTKHIDSLTTGPHRNFVSADGGKTFKFELSDHIHGKRRQWVRAATPAVGVGLSALERLAIATVADGTLKDNNVHFHLKKKRKIDKILSVCDELGVKPNLYPDKCKPECWYLTIPSGLAKRVISLTGRPKNLSFLRDSRYPQECLSEYTFYDGHGDRRLGMSSSSITSVNQGDLDVLSELCVLAGIPCSISPCRPGGYPSDRTCFKLNMAELQQTRVNKDRSFTVDYTGNVWSLCNPNTTLFVRRNGKVYVSGNSAGRAFDFVCQYDAQYVRERIAAEWAKSGLGWPITMEQRVHWLHIDVRSNKRLVNYF